jgi:hypothetical protein
MGNAVRAALVAIAAFATPAQGQVIAVDPIPGSLTYPTQPKTKLKKAPVGSIVQHSFHSNGVDYRETYRIQPDRSLKLLNRREVLRE